MAADSLESVDDFSRRACSFIDSGEFARVLPVVDTAFPWSPQSLDACEALYLQRQGQLSATLEEYYIMYLGEGLRRTYGGRWSDAGVMSPHLRGNIGIYYDATLHFDVVPNFLKEADFLGIGQTWSASFAATAYLIGNNH